MIFEAHQNPYFVRLCCINILTKHIFNYKIGGGGGGVRKENVERKCKSENAMTSEVLQNPYFVGLCGIYKY